MEVLYVHKIQKKNILILKFKKPIYLKIEDDNPRQFYCKCRYVNVKNAKFERTRTAMPLTTFSRRFFGSLGGAPCEYRTAPLHPKIISLLFQIQKTHLKKEVDNPRQFDYVSVDL